MAVNFRHSHDQRLAAYAPIDVLTCCMKAAHGHPWHLDACQLSGTGMQACGSSARESNCLDALLTQQPDLLCPQHHCTVASQQVESFSSPLHNDQ